MIRIILGVIVGFIAWTILWLGGEQVIESLSSWFAHEMGQMQAAVASNSTYQVDPGVLSVNLVRSVAGSVISGYLCAIVAGENRRSTLALGVLLLAVGIFFEVTFWKYIAVWYHVAFLVLLIPTTYFGGKLKRFSR